MASVLSGTLDGVRGVVAGLALGWPLLRHRGWLLWLGFRVYPGLVLVAVVGLVLVRRGAGGWAGRWVVAGGFLSSILYSI